MEVKKCELTDYTENLVNGSKKCELTDYTENLVNVSKKCELTDYTENLVNGSKKCELTDYTENLGAVNSEHSTESFTLVHSTVLWTDVVRYQVET